MGLVELQVLTSLLARYEVSLYISRPNVNEVFNTHMDLLTVRACLVTDM